MNILLLKGFNNYFNRIVKKYSTLADYKTNSSAYLEFTNINFNSNDGVSTELIIGNSTQTEGDQVLFWEYNGAPDYLVCYDTGDNESIIRSRWFILEAQRTRQGQYRIAVKRDVIAENFSAIINAPCFVEKGVIADNSDPLLFNSENMSFNQIKQSEVLLKDKTNCGWIVGYVTQDKQRYPNGSTYYESTSPVATYEQYADVPAILKTLASIGTFQRPVAILNTSWGVPAGRCQMAVYWNALKDPMSYQKIWITNVPWAEDLMYETLTTTAPSNGYLYAAWGGEQVMTANTYSGAGAQALMEGIRFNATLRNYYVNNILTNGVDFSDADQSTIEAWNGRYFKNNGKIYQIVYEQTGNRIMGPNWAINAGTSYYTELMSIWSSTVGNTSGTFFAGDASNVYNSAMRVLGPATGVKFCDLAWEYYTAQVKFVEVPVDAGDIIKTYIPATRIQACDTPMDIFAIPFSDEFTIYTAVDSETGDPTGGITMSKQAALQAAVSLAQAGSNVYDIQIVPYFPNPALISTDEEAGGDGLIYDNAIIMPYCPLTEDVHYNYFYNSTNAKLGIIFWSRTSVFTTDIDAQISLANTNALTLKMSNETDLYRLTSPNYAGSFEFSLAKSGGRIVKFNADCTYKPYSPYIHVTPDLAGLYGENFSTIDDARGLICGGDFSITKIVDKWQEYELQNKNYQNMFDRQIQNMDVNNQMAMEQQDWKNQQGIINMIGSLATVGGIASFGKSAIANPFTTEVGAIKETDWLRRSQEEAKDYTQDMYGYQLGNIKALPIALSKTAAQTNNNKIFPFVEYFTATAMEKSALEDKLKYNGMTIMKIGKLSNYITSSDFDKVYVKGQLIRLEGVNDDFHVIDAIYQEVNKGFFVTQ